MHRVLSTTPFPLSGQSPAGTNTRFGDHATRNSDGYLDARSPLRRSRDCWRHKACAVTV